MGWCLKPGAHGRTDDFTAARLLTISGRGTSDGSSGWEGHEADRPGRRTCSWRGRLAGWSRCSLRSWRFNRRVSTNRGLRVRLHHRQLRERRLPRTHLALRQHRVGEPDPGRRPDRRFRPYATRPRYQQPDPDRAALPADHIATRRQRGRGHQPPGYDATIVELANLPCTVWTHRVDDDGVRPRAVGPVFATRLGNVTSEVRSPPPARAVN